MQKTDNQGISISIIIPAYKQEKTIRKDLLRIKQVMDQLRYAYEIIVVVDGNVDKTLEVAKKVKDPHIQIIGYQRNHGKGYAIRYGMIRSKGNVVGFIDSGMEINLNGLSLLIEQFEWAQADMIIGSKRHPASRVEYPFVRKLISLGSQLLIKFLFGLNVSDTQVGLKFFRREVIENVMPRLLVKKFAFDIEILVVAYHLGYRRIIETPIELQFDFKQSIVSQNLFMTLLNTLWDTLAIFYRLKIKRYYDV